MDSFSSLQNAISSALVATTRSAGAVASEDLSFHRSLDASLGSELDAQSARLLSLADRLLGTATANSEIVRPARLKDLENVEDNWRAVVDVVDSLLERADTALDEFTGAVKRLSPGADEATSKTSKSSKSASRVFSSDIAKPQLLFDNVPDNKASGPWRPLLETKPHARTPLVTEPVQPTDDSAPYFPHPYQTEIEQYRYPASMYTQSEPIMYKPFEETSATFVDTEEALEEMLTTLKGEKEIAIDLEHHDNRSYIGIVSLMQISTRDRDWIVDTLKPWRRKLQCLNEVFANPNVLKILQGAFMDVVWLQRDLGLYLVGYFDTHYAARSLGYAGGSLAFLLKKFVGIDAQKQYQMADWRIRPLPQELIDYARSDTHYLLYVFDCMRNELIERSNFSVPDHEKDRVWDVLVKSSETALQRYENPTYDVELGQGAQGWYKLLNRTPASFNKQQFAVFRAVHNWRDDVAREQDDSTNYIMPNHNIFTLAKALPTSRADLPGLLHPMTKTVKERAGELIAVVNRAIANGDSGPEMVDVLRQVEPRHTRKFERFANHTLTSSGAGSTVSGGPINPPGTSQSLPMRASTSTFWGSLWNNTSSKQTRAASTTNPIELAVPLPPLTAEVFADPAEQSAAAYEHTDVPELSIPQPAETSPETNDAFILKNMGKKRKQADRQDGMAAQSDEVAIEDGAMDAKARRIYEKAERKKAKRALKASMQPGTEEAGLTSDTVEEPFDYASAPSILNPPREFMTAKERRKQEKQLNPYAKAMDAAKGLPRVQKERAGRSMTFKS